MSAGHVGGEQAAPDAVRLLGEGAGLRDATSHADIAVLTGGLAITESSGASSRRSTDRPQACQTGLGGRENTTIIEGAGKTQAINGASRSQVPDVKTDSDYDKEKLQGIDQLPTALRDRSAPRPRRR